LMAGVNN
ncbi:histone H1-like nucleoHC2 family protein, partial [Chlamydia psittaci 08-2626_L3]